MLGLPVLRYDIGIIGEKNIGCISQSINNHKEILIEGLQILQAYDSTFAVFNRAGQGRYSYQLIEKALVSVGLSVQMNRILETIVFDAIIGNQDRHQENWALVMTLADSDNTISGIFSIIQKGYFYKQAGFSEFEANRYVTHYTNARFAPIYDNGSSLGRELTTQRINDLLRDERSLLAYIRKGKAEIRWYDKKISHFDLLVQLNQQSGYIWFDSILKQVVDKFDVEQFYEILESVDQLVPESFKNYKLPSERKQLILRLVKSRIDFIKTLLITRY